MARKKSLFGSLLGGKSRRKPKTLLGTLIGTQSRKKSTTRVMTGPGGSRTI